MRTRSILRLLSIRDVAAGCSTVLIGMLVAASSAIVAPSPTRRAPSEDAEHGDAERRVTSYGAHVERAACGICGHVDAMADAAFCGDCGLLVHLECVGGYCDACCQPRCARCVARAAGGACVRCGGRTDEPTRRM